MAASWDEQSTSCVLDGTEHRTAQRARWSGMVSDIRRDPGHGGGGRLGRAVEAEIVPRLLLGHREAPPRDGLTGWLVSPDEVADAARCAVGGIDALDVCVAGARARGADVEAVFLDLLAPAARHLGDLWVDDSLSFVDVTIGLVRLHHALRGLAPLFRAEAAVERQGRRALLVPAPGEQHSFGLAMVTEFFRRAGWGVWSGTPASFDELLRLVRGEWFGVVGFSVACDDRLEALATCIRRVRAASRNPTIGVMVGGPIFSLHPDLALAVGADATAGDARHAAFRAEGLLALQPMPRG